MEWATPSFVEIKMDAEIGSYQADDEPNEPVSAPKDKAPEKT